MKKSTLARRIAQKQAQLHRLDERIGQLMAQRADVEEALADLLRKDAAMQPENQPGVIAKEIVKSCAT